MTPLILLDVDGPLSPFAAKAPPPGYAEHRIRLSRWRRKPELRFWLNAGHGAALLELASAGAELVWATSWEQRANQHIGPVLGLPSLPVIHFTDPRLDWTWKYPTVARYAGRRPLLWFDDDFDLYPRHRDEFLVAREGVPTELVRVSPRTGLTEEHLDFAREWLTQCVPPVSPGDGPANSG
ncbi:hypothetical protein JOF53_005204 [Crossiella equi]|uniref:Secreted protein n=1 Tax=Crossiella equi TaxID=130796 RepID=A0ABS5AID0_9PSEU|nr:HAD domain-containing protein [Crossiella equi]MBP2476332.1 hypothetical protein [Crossiella equi]